ncbi:methionine-binding protein [Neisseria perflava]|uniref:methionine-binding protein n=1 Tax=Neisseria perflava TaxID=33053 RepID=UPI00209DC231|nr:methionine-binding protein [Neisseria perflava]MCP1659818.1 hypothetical protein [Neisseria perflava]MCP1772637.1 hypothetical protein [Neisseria perflava]
MDKPLILFATALLLGGYLYQETPYSRTAVVNLPVVSQTTVNKTVTVNAPPGTTVIYQEAAPVGVSRYPRRYYRYNGD